MTTISQSRFVCAVCGASDRELTYTLKHKFFWCYRCRITARKNKTEFLSLKAQEISTSDYYVYALMDPRDQSIRYIGMSKQPEVRLIRHTYQKEYAPKYAWLKELQEQGLLPILKVIETAGKDKAYAFKRETYWIHYFISQDAPLLNAQARKQAS